jgi:S-adenosylmethionine synthetase
VASETLVTTGMAMVAGEVTTSAYVDVREIVRRTVQRIGYTDARTGFDYRTCAVLTSIGRQSADIARGVDRQKADQQGAGDQGMMFGYATDETAERMPLPAVLAHRLAERLAAVRRGGRGVPHHEWLRPDGKTQVSVEYEGDRPVGIKTVVVSTQHDDRWQGRVLGHRRITEAMREDVIAPVLDAFGFDGTTPRILVNPTGRFVIGGPMGDAGLTGRKIIVDTYGGAARHGGGAFSGKDPSKVDRSAAYAMRWVAKNAVAAGLADRLEVQVAYAIGKAAPVGLYVETFGTGVVADDVITRAIREVFDLRPAAIIRDLDLLRPIYAATAAYGHFGRELPAFTWERLDRVDELRAAAKL